MDDEDGAGRSQFKMLLVAEACLNILFPNMQDQVVGSNAHGSKVAASRGGLEQAYPDAWASAYSSVAAGAALVAGLGVLAFMRRA
nr:hypothetical protein [Tanacetum cinerariifolium]GEZ03583.1 hypothetical protein [Tanacetum cinerariifolium]